MAAAVVPRAPAGFRAGQSRVRSQRIDGAGAAWLTSRVIWPTLAADGDGRPGDGLALADRVAERAGCHLTVTGVPGQPVTLTPPAATAAGPAVHALDTLPQDRAGPDDLGVFQLPADAAEEVLGGGNHAAQRTGLGGGWPHAEHDADDR